MNFVVVTHPTTGAGDFVVVVTVNSYSPAVKPINSCPGFTTVPSDFLITISDAKVVVIVLGIVNFPLPARVDTYSCTANEFIPSENFISFCCASTVIGTETLFNCVFEKLYAYRLINVLDVIVGIVKPIYPDASKAVLLNDISTPEESFKKSHDNPLFALI